MKEHIIELLSELPHEWATFIIAMIPITEVRASIPIALTLYEMGPVAAFFYSVAGNVLVGILTIFFVEKLLDFFLQRSEKLNNLWQKYINRIRTKNIEKFDRWGSLALIAFVAIPLPLTGIVTGAVAASIFQVPFQKAVPLLAIGSAISSLIMIFGTMGVSAFF